MRFSGSRCRPDDEPERDRRPRRPRRRRTHRRLVHPGQLRVEANRLEVAVPPLARAHRHGRVPLRELDRVESLCDRALHVLRGHVLADADEPLAPAGSVVGSPRHRLLADVTRDGADGAQAGWNLGRHEDALHRLVLDARAGRRQQRVGGLAAARHDDEVATERPTVDRHAPHAAPAAVRAEPRRPAAGFEPERVEDPRAGTLESPLGPAGGGVGRDHDRALPGPDRIPVDESFDGGGQHHPDEVVPGKDQRLVERPGGDDDVLGAKAKKHAAALDRHQPAFPDADRTRGSDHLGPRDVEVCVLRQLVDEHDAPAVAGMRCRGLAPGPAPAHDEHARAPVLDVVAPVRIALGHPAEARDAAKEPLVQRPEPARADHRPVVEADRRERPAHLVDDPEEIVVEGTDHVLRLDDRSLARRLLAGADVRHPVDRDHAVGAVAAAAEDPARPVVLERARDDSATGRVERRAEGVPGERPDGRPAEAERDLAAPIEQLARLRRKPHPGVGLLADSGTETARTSFVRVSRSATNQSSQPERWFHHSR